MIIENSNPLKKEDLLSVAKFGKTMGLVGYIRLHILSDFPESLKSGNEYYIFINHALQKIILQDFKPKNSVAKFANFNSKEEARMLTNLVLYSTKEDSYKTCHLEDYEFFWHEVIGAVIVENEENLGIVTDIERYGAEDYLLVSTDQQLLKSQPKLPKSFLIPYNARYILKTLQSDQKRCGIIKVCKSKEILENS